MGLDIYAGTLTRYYAGNWKSVVQQMAEANGYSFSRITPNGDKIDEGDAMSPEEIRKQVEDWRDWILQAIKPEDHEPYEPWQEDNEKPYYTDKPDWDAFGALLLYTACAVYGEKLPPTVSKNWDFQEHPVIKRICSDEDKHWSLFADAIWWLPLDESFYFTAPRPTNDTAVIATVGGLKKELDRINELGWNADEDDILSWTETEGYPVDAEISETGGYSQVAESVHTQYSTESLAKFAFSIMWRAVKFSMETRVPILMDF